MFFSRNWKNLILELIHWLLTWFIAGERCTLWQVAMFLLTSLTCFAFVNIGRGNRNLFEMPSYEIRYARYIFKIIQWRVRSKFDLAPIPTMISPSHNAYRGMFNAAFKNGNVQCSIMARLRGQVGCSTLRMLDLENFHLDSYYCLKLQDPLSSCCPDICQINIDFDIDPPSSSILIDKLYTANEWTQNKS